MSSRCPACGSDSGDAFAFCPYCGASHASGEQPEPPETPAPPTTTVAFDRPGSFYQPIEVVQTERATPGPAARLDGSGVAPWVAADFPAFGIIAHDPGPPDVELPDVPETTLVYLVVRHGRDAASFLGITGDVLIGRGPEAGLMLTDPAVLERHGWIRRESHAVAFEAIDSAPATVVVRDGQRVHVIGRHMLRDGDTLVLGTTQLRVVVIEPLSERS